MLADCKSGGSYQLLPYFFFVNHFYTCSSPWFWCAIFVLQHFVQFLYFHFFRRFIARLDVFGSESVVVTCFTLFEATNGSLYFFSCELRFFMSHVFVIAFLLGFPSPKPSFEGLVLLLQSGFQHMACCRIHRRHLQFLFSK